MTVIQAYAPTQNSPDTDVENFYKIISLAVSELRSEVLMIIGDFNAKAGKRQNGEDQIMGPFGYGERNNRGENLITWLWQEGFCTGNSLFEKKETNKWTWLSPDGQTKNLIDYILINKKSVLMDVAVLTSFKFETDHRLIRAKLLINHKTRKLVNQFGRKELPKLITEINKIKYTQNLQNYNQKNNQFPLQTRYNELESTIKSCADKSLNVLVNRKEEKLSDHTKNLIEEKQKLQSKQNKTSEEKSKLKHMKKQIHIKVKEDVEKYDNEMVKEILASTGSMKKIKNQLSDGKSWMPSLVENNKERFARNEIMRTASNFYKELYTSKKNTDLFVAEDSFQYSNYEAVLPFTSSEIHQSIIELSSDKCKDDNGIKAEYLKCGGDIMIEHLKNLFNEILQKEIFPEQWLHSSIILLYKKGNKKDIGNYRPISIISIIYKVFAKCIGRRMQVKFNENQPREQAGFRSGYSTTDHLHTINQLIEKSIEYNFEVYLAFVDFKKAFDSIEHDSIWNALQNQGIENKYIRLLKKLYDNSYAHLKLEKPGPPFKLGRGVRQGDPLSPQLFAAVLEECFRRLDWSSYGLTILGEKLNNLRFADDIVLISRNAEELQEMISDLNEKCNQAGLEINMSKTVLMSNTDKIEIFIGKQQLEYVEEFTYLGQIISFENRLEKEINRRITNAWKQFWSLKHLLKVNFNNEIIKYIFDVGILPVLTYGAQTWSLTQKLKHKLQVCQRSMERSLIGVSRRQRIRNSIIRSRTQITDVAYKARCLKWAWAGHIIRLQDERWTKLITHWCPLSNVRDVGRQKIRWRDELSSFCTNWCSLAFDRSVWKEMEEAYAQCNQT